MHDVPAIGWWLSIYFSVRLRTTLKLSQLPSVGAEAVVHDLSLSATTRISFVLCESPNIWGGFSSILDIVAQDSVLSVCDLLLL